MACLVNHVSPFVKLISHPVFSIFSFAIICQIIKLINKNLFIFAHIYTKLAVFVIHSSIFIQKLTHWGLGNFSLFHKFWCVYILSYIYAEGKRDYHLGYVLKGECYGYMSVKLFHCQSSFACSTSILTLMGVNPNTVELSIKHLYCGNGLRNGCPYTLGSCFTCLQQF